MAASDISLEDRNTDDIGGEFRLGYISLLAGIVGVLAGIIAFLIYKFIGLLSNVFFHQEIGFEFAYPLHHVPIWMPLIPAFGGLVVGLMARYGSPRIRGHGIPEAMEAVWDQDSMVKARVMILKPISAAIAIGTGAPFGVEGPIIQTGGSMGSVLGQWISTTIVERKVLLACGATAGMAATFNTPIAGILISIELLLFEFKTRSFIPLAIASIFATAVRRVILERGPMLEIHSLEYSFIESIPFLILLGVILGIAVILFKRGYFWVEHQFDRVPVGNVYLPALGGLLFGLTALLAPEALGVGYEVAQTIMNLDTIGETPSLADSAPLVFIFAMIVLKSLGVSLTLGSRTSGGFLAPMFVVGAGIGGAYAILINRFVLSTFAPGMQLSLSLFALVGLGTLFGVAGRATFAMILFTVEVTHAYEAILPVFLVAVVADAVAATYLGNSLMTEELVQRGISVDQGYEVNILKRFSVDDVLDSNPVTIEPDVTVSQLITELETEPETVPQVDLDTNGGHPQEETVDEDDQTEATGGAERMEAGSETDQSDQLGQLGVLGQLSDAEDADSPTLHEALPLIDPDEGLVGIVTYGDLLRAMTQDRGDASVIEVGTTDLVVGYRDERIFEAAIRMASDDIEQLLIVSRDDPSELVGLLDSQNLMTSALRQLEEEQVREEGKFTSFRNYLPR
jgi:CIC family chloride channel protein